MGSEVVGVWLAFAEWVPDSVCCLEPDTSLRAESGT